ncbi:MAG TPA: CGNR zinc finger domain-containing protein [Thermomicrobiaceae bacterium]|nr:CGNR zinc finger domain-containing protein [Thermomicrobiaceae bacterium]
MALTDSAAAALSLIGGVLCLDFANTVGDHAGEHPHEILRGYDDLLAWSSHAGVLNDELAGALHDLAERDPVRARRALSGAIELREAIYDIFATIAHDETPERIRLTTLNDALAQSFARLTLLPAGPAPSHDWLIPLPSKAESVKGSRQHPGTTVRAFQLAWQVHDLDLNLPCWPVAYSAAQLLASTRLDRVRQCAGDDCGWLFLDTSRNHSRRWCDMSDCGNRAKARRHYRRARAGADGG